MRIRPLRKVSREERQEILQLILDGKLPELTSVRVAEALLADNEHP